MSSTRPYLQSLATHIGKAFPSAQFRGKWRLATAMGKALSKVCPEAHCFPHPQGKVAVRLSYRVERLMWGRCYEPELVAVLKSLLAPGDVFMDIGAHIGYFAVLAAALVGTQGVVHAFEPDPACFSRLTLNAANYSCMRTYAIALSDKPGEASFFVSDLPDQSGWGTLLESNEPRSEIRVPATTLDSWLEANIVGRIDLVKLDVEGAEYRVLSGAKGTINQHHPTLYVEANETCLARDAKSVQDLLRLLATHGYTAQGVLDQRKQDLVALLAVPSEKVELFRMLDQRRVRLRPLAADSLAHL